TDAWFDLTITDSTVCSDNLPLKKIKDDYLIRSKKIKVFPTQEQKEILFVWITLYRYVYNLTIKYTRQNPEHKEHNKLYNFINLRTIITKIIDKNEHMSSWIKYTKM